MLITASKRRKLEVLERQLAITKLRCENSFYEFFKTVWREVLECSNPLVENWHLEYLCHIAEKEVHRIGRGEPKTFDIIINIPPRSLKSTIFSICLNAWAWIHYPWMKFLSASYDEGLSTEHAVKTRTIVRSTWYQTLWGENFGMAKDQQLKTYFENDKLGYRVVTSVGAASATGHGGDIIIVDDPLSPKQAESEVYRKAAIDWWQSTFYSRLNDDKKGVRIIIMQRLHEEDLTGHELENRRDYYKLIRLPLIISEDVSPANLKQFYVGGYLFPTRFDEAFIKNRKKVQGSYVFSGQYQQVPSPEEGGLFKKRYWKYWQFKGDSRIPVKIRTDNEVVELPLVELPDTFDDIVDSWDMTYKDTEGTDFVAGHCWGRKGADKFLLQRIYARLNFKETVDKVRELKQDNEYVTAVLIEGKANGPAVINTLEHEVEGLIEVPANDSKMSRALPMSAQAEAGNIYLPHPDLDDSIDDFVEQFAKFPKGKHDDEVDAASQAINFLSDPNRQVVGAFKYGSNTQRRNFLLTEINQLPQYLSNIAAIVQQEDLAMAHLFAAYDAIERKLWVYDELLDEYSVPSTAVAEMRSRMASVFRAEKFIAEPSMFSEKPAHRTLVRQYKENGIRLVRPIRYDENGAIALVMQMFFQERIIIHKKCVHTALQLKEWTIRNGRPKTKNVGLAECLCLIVSDLDRRFKIVEAPQQSRMGYAPVAKERANVGYLGV